VFLNYLKILSAGTRICCGLQALIAQTFQNIYSVSVQLLLIFMEIKYTNDDNSEDEGSKLF
jgi:hypothetical protein